MQFLYPFDTTNRKQQTKVAPFDHQVVSTLVHLLRVCLQHFSLIGLRLDRMSVKLQRYNTNSRGLEARPSQENVGACGAGRASGATGYPGGLGSRLLSFGKRSGDAFMYAGWGNESLSVRTRGGGHVRHLAYAKYTPPYASQMRHLAYNMGFANQ